MDEESSWTAGWWVLVELSTRIVSPDWACSNGLGSLLLRIFLSFETAGFMSRGCTTIVSSSSIDVASVVDIPSAAEEDGLPG